MTYDRKPQTRTTVVSGACPLDQIEALEHTGEVRLWNPGTAVIDGYHEPSVHPCGTQLDRRILRRIMRSVLDHILYDVVEPDRICTRAC